MWRTDETPQFLADVRNTGKLQLSVAQAQQLCEIEVDDKTYRWVGDLRIKTSDFSPGRSYSNIPVLLDKHWQATKGEKLKWAVGKHKVRIVFLPSGLHVQGSEGALELVVDLEGEGVQVLRTIERDGGDRRVGVEPV